MKKVNYTDKAIKELENSFVKIFSVCFFLIGCIALGMTIVVTSVAFISTGDIDWVILGRALLVSLCVCAMAVAPFYLAVLRVSHKLEEADKE